MFSRAEVRDPPEGDRQGRTSVHSHLHAGFFSSPPGKVRKGRRAVAFLGGASPASQRNRKTGPTHRAWCQVIIRGDPALLHSGSRPRPPAPLAPRKQAPGCFPLHAKCLAWVWRSGWSWGSFPVRCRSPGQRAGKVWMSLWAHLWQSVCSPCLAPSLAESREGVLASTLDGCSLRRRNELSGSGSKPWAEWEKLPCSGAIWERPVG